MSGHELCSCFLVSSRDFTLGANGRDAPTQYFHCWYKNIRTGFYKPFGTTELHFAQTYKERWCANVPLELSVDTYLVTKSKKRCVVDAAHHLTHTTMISFISTEV